MTTVSIAVSLVAALITGGLGGYWLRHVRQGEAWAIGCASALGLILLQTSSLRDLLRPLQPRVALDWLPLIVLLAVACSNVRTSRYRWPLAILIGLLFVLRLLWGSVYMQLESLSVPLGITFGCWAMTSAVAMAMALPSESKPNRLSWNTGGWGILIAIVATTITMSGSLTYGAATGVCGLAAFGVLVSTSRISNVIAIPLASLVGLSTAYAELAPWAGSAILAAMIGLLLAEGLQMPTARLAVRAGGIVTVLIIGGLTFSQFAKDFEGDEQPDGGYGDLSTNESGVAPSSADVPTSPSHTPAMPEPALPPMNNSPSDGIETIDPFGGIGLPGQ